MLSRVELRLCTEDGLQLGAQDEAVALAVWGVDASSYDDMICLPALYITVSGGQAAADERRYSFISPVPIRFLDSFLLHQPGWTRFANAARM